MRRRLERLPDEPLGNPRDEAPPRPPRRPASASSRRASSLWTRTPGSRSSAMPSAMICSTSDSLSIRSVGRIVTDLLTSVRAPRARTRAIGIVSRAVSGKADGLRCRRLCACPHPAPKHDHVVDTACPLDCPDSCSLLGRDRRRPRRQRSTARAGTRSPTASSARRSGSSASACTGPLRVMHPMVRIGPKGNAAFSRVTWDEAIDLVAGRLQGDARHVRRRVDPALLLRRVERAADAGYDRRPAVPAAAARRGWRAPCARRRPGAAAQALYGKMPSVTYQDFAPREAHRHLGREPVGVGHPPRAVHPGRAQAGREARRGRSAASRRSRATADLHVPLDAGHRPRGGAGPPSPPVRDRAPPTRRFSRAHADGADRLRERAAEWTFERAASVAGVQASMLREFAELYAAASPGARAMRVGARAEPERRQRGGRGAGAAGRGREVRRARRRLRDEQLVGVGDRTHLDRRARAGHAPRQHEPPRAGSSPRTPDAAGEGAVRLQLQPGGHASRTRTSC